MTGPTQPSGSRQPPGLAGLVILLAGATGQSGIATARALTAAGATVVAVGRDRARLAAALTGIPGIRSEVVDLGSPGRQHRDWPTGSAQSSAGSTA